MEKYVEEGLYFNFDLFLRRENNIPWQETSDFFIQHDIHCSMSHPINFFYIKDYFYKANRGEDLKIIPRNLAVPIYKDEAFKTWMKHNLGIKKEPAWSLVSFWEM